MKHYYRVMVRLMKHIEAYFRGDGMADWPAESLGNKTLLQYSSTPIWISWHEWDVPGGWLQLLPDFIRVVKWRICLLWAIIYRRCTKAVGRWKQQASGWSCNRAIWLCVVTLSVSKEKIKNHSSGHISTEEADVLVQYLEEKLGSDRFISIPVYNTAI